MADDVAADDSAESIEQSVENPDRPLEPWFESYIATKEQPGVLEPAGRLGADCETAAHGIVEDLVADDDEDRWRRFTRKLSVTVLDAYWCEPDGEIWTEEESDRPFAG